MHIISGAIVIALLFGLGLVLKRVWLERKQASVAEGEEAASTDEHGTNNSGFSTQLVGVVQSRWQQLRRGLGSEEENDEITQFRTWVTTAFTDDPDLVPWLTTLSDEQLGALLQHLRTFCLDMGFEVSWLFDGQLMQNDELRRALTQIVYRYHRASYEAVQIQGEVELFRIYHDLMKNPQSRVNRELGEHLFGKLVEQKATTISISEHLAASTRVRQKQVVETIQQVAVTDPKLLDATLKTVLWERTAGLMNGAPIATNGNGVAANGAGHSASNA